MDINGKPDAKFDDWRWWLQALRQSVESDTIFDPRLTPSPSIGKTGVEGQQRVPAEAIATVVQDFLEQGKALRIRGAHISGHLGVTLRPDQGYLSITESNFEHPAHFHPRQKSHQTHLSGLNLAGNRMQGLRIEGDFGGSLILADAKVYGSLLIGPSEIRGDLVLDGIDVWGNARLNNLEIEGLATIQGANLRAGLIAHGVSASLLNLSDSTLRGEPALALHQCVFPGKYFEEDHARDDRGITGTVNLRNVETAGKISIWHTRGERLDLSNATLCANEAGADRFAITLDSDAEKSTADDWHSDYTYMEPNRNSSFRKISADGLIIAGQVDAAAHGVLGPSIDGRNQVLRGWSRVVGSTFASWPIVLVTALVVFAVLWLSGPVSVTDPVLTIGGGLFIAGVSGVMSCAVLENLKRLLRLRGLYQMLTFRTWLNHRVGSRATGLRAYVEFIILTGATFSPYLPVGIKPTKRHTHALANLRLFDLPIEQLAAQLFDVTETVLRNPKKYRALCRAMAGVDYPINHPDETTVAEFDARARRSVDHMQITIGDGWRRYLVGAATGLSGGVGILLVEMYEVPWLDPRATVLLSTFIGGFVAWLTRDLAVGLSKLRR
ncbi:hypothetical protein [Pseudarthrobacter sulfonivorans]|uniref:hypothetical protein n=1 Tax=Pseudarthrobacter sulfonivorans TaxID=121292 RepID=UPI00285FB580|nr:hypothetical protein [Pseudarthrobacter sulfonivorans]MDR6417568.1 hypothetical protein [Pseudarthrobacter sulfonivorans]